MKANSDVKPYKGVEVKGGLTKYAVSQSQKQADGTWKTIGWLNVMVHGGKPIPDKNPARQILHIDSISAVDIGEYNGKQSTTVWAEGYVVGEPEDTQAAPIEGFSQLTDEDIPF